jgi:hypothetical protein
MAPEGADAGRDDDAEGPPTVRMPTSRPAPGASGVFEVAAPVLGVLIDGVLWAPPPRPGVPAEGEILSQGVYRRT